MSRASSVLDLLISDLGISERRAWNMIEPIVEWFDGLEPGLARAMLPTLVAALSADTPTEET